MLAITSFSSNDSLPLSPASSIPPYLICFFATPSFLFAAFVAVNTLLVLPPCVFILHHGLRQWRATRSSSSSSTAAASHSDVFTYHLATMELFSVSGYFLCCCGVYRENVAMVMVAFPLVSFTWFGEMYFHLLTSVERHLAVVHPVSYRRLRTERGVRLRNGAVGGVWLLSAAGMWLVMMRGFATFDLCFLCLVLAVILFCSLSVLRALIRPGPGEQGGARGRVDQSKQRAFNTIALILLVLVMRLAWNLVWSVRHMQDLSLSCEVMGYEMWFNLPCSLVLPMLFLHRHGNLPRCHRDGQ